MPKPPAAAARRRRILPVLLAGTMLALGGGAGGLALAQSGKPPPLGAPDAPPPGWGGGGSAAPAPAPQPPQRAPGPSAGGGGPVAGSGGKPPPLPPGSGPFGAVPGEGAGRQTRSSGTGFVVAPGRILTNHHVAEGCSELRLRTAGGAEISATLLAADAERDLALLAARGEAGPPLRFRSGPNIRRGEGVVTYGFPLAGLLSSGPTLTTGDISALTGLRDNPAHYQISAPVQPGNSGGPLLDLNGLVVGVVTSKLNAQRVAQSTGDIPQNVNFAVKANEAVEFLRRQGVQPQVTGAAGTPRNAAEVGELAHPSVLFLRCMR